MTMSPVQLLLQFYSLPCHFTLALASLKKTGVPVKFSAND